MIKRIVTLSLALILPACAEASQIFAPSGPFQLMTPQLPACATQPPQPGQQFRCVPISSSSDDHANATGQTLDRADGFMFHGRANLAADEIKAALVRTPADAVLWHFSARLKLAAGNLAEARADLGRSLELDAENGDALATAAYLLSRTGELRSALEAYDRALARSPDNQFALVESLHLSEQLDDPTLAELALSRLEERWPDNPVVVGRAIDRDMRLGNFRSALERADAAARKGANKYGDRVKRVAILQAVGDHDRAVRELGELLNSDSSTPRFAIDLLTRAKLRFIRATSYKELKRLDEARRDVSDALRDADARLRLRISVFLVSNGFEDLEVSDKPSKELENSAVACILNVACGRGLTRKI